MDVKKIKQLVSLVETSDISSLSIQEDHFKIEIKRESPPVLASPPLPTVQTVSIPATAQPPVNAPPSAPPVVPTTEASPSIDEGLVDIKSPMVGTFYSRPNPESPAFVTPGATIKKGDVVCIVEAMKLFNDIESEHDGVVDRMCVQDGDPVEYGQSLFFVRKH